MRVAVISDIHGNIYSLMRVLDDISEQRVDKIICLGDLVGYGPHPNEVISLIQRREMPCLKGNYDVSVVDGEFSFIRETSVNSFSLPWTIEETRMSNKYFLNTLPKELNYEFENIKFKFVHGSPNAINEYLFEDNDNIKEIIDNMSEDILVCAHTHIPYVKDFENKKIINVGSVGKPKIGNPNGTYALIEVVDGQVLTKIREVEYEYNKIVKDMQILNFPSQLINSYKTGKE